MPPALRLIRLPNLLIVALTQALLYFGLFLPAFEAYNIDPVLPPLHFTLFVLVTMVVSAAGYIINDIEDVAIDEQNRPGQVVVGHAFSAKQAYRWYWALHVLGMGLALYLAQYVGQLALAALYPAAALLLHLYSTHLQRWALVGNVVVALFCAGVAGIVWFAERAGFAQLTDLAPARAGQVGGIVTWYLVFAFLSTLYRELVKDIEDQKGDTNGRYRTVPVLWGERTAKALAAAFGVGLGLFIALMLFSDLELFRRQWLYYFGGSLLLPLGWSLYGLFGASTQAEYHRVSQAIKLIMLGGLLLLGLLVLT